MVKKRYYRLANGNESFNKEVFLFARKKSLLVVVHYRGDTSAIQHKPHGNRKQFLERAHVRIMPLTLKINRKIFRTTQANLQESCCKTLFIRGYAGEASQINKTSC